MDGVREYVFSAVCAGVICSVLGRLTEKTGCKEEIRVLCGLFLTIVLVRPVGNLRKLDLGLYFSQWEQQAQQTVSEGILSAEEQKATIIKQQTEAYILTKAAALHAAVEVNVTVGEGGIPVSVKLSGGVSPFARSVLAEQLETELGIPREHQQWTQ